LGIPLDTFQEWNGSDKHSYSPGETVRVMGTQVKDTPIRVVVGEEDLEKFTDKKNG